MLPCPFADHRCSLLFFHIDRNVWITDQYQSEDPLYAPLGIRDMPIILQSLSRGQLLHSPNGP